MQPIDPLQRAWPLFDADASRAIEQAALARHAPYALMARAGAAVARLALAVAPHARSVWVAAGPGNNGGDGLEAALGLRQAGKPVQVSLLADAARLPADAARALARARDGGVPITPGLPPDGTGGGDLAIDALLGLGTSRAPENTLAEAIARMAASGTPVLAVDLPSGLHPTTGQPIGRQAVRAAHTLALLTLKPGLFTGAGRDHAGRVWLDTLGVVDTDTDTDADVDGTVRPVATLSGGSDAARPAPRAHGQHKGSFGDVHVVGGAATMSGAALLAARAAHAAGAGKVYVSLLDADGPTYDLLRPELMFRPGAWRAQPARLAGGVVVCGCGGSGAVRAALPAVIEHAGRLVLDADALNAIAADAALQRAVAARSAPTVLTPHPLEAARLLGRSTADVQADRLEAARELAQRYRAVAVLKGSGSVIAAPGGALCINPTGNAALGTAGTGDVLAGWLGGLWAQAGTAEAVDPAELAQRVATQAVFRHGLAADLAGRPTHSLRAGDLIERLHELG